MKEKTMRLPIFIACAALTAATGAAFVTGAVQAVPNPATEVVLPKGTVVSLRLETDLKSGRDKAGKSVLFTVNQNVYSKSHVLLLETRRSRSRPCREFGRTRFFGPGGQADIHLRLCAG